MTKDDHLTKLEGQRVEGAIRAKVSVHETYNSCGQNQKEFQEKYNSTFSQNSYKAVEHYRSMDGNEHRDTYNKTSRKKNNSVLMLLIMIFTFPVWFPILISIVAVLFAVLVTIAAILFSFGVAGIAVLATAVLMIAAGVVKALTSPLLGVAIVSASILCAGIGLLLIVIAAWACAVVLPACARGCAAVCRSLCRLVRGGR